MSTFFSSLSDLGDLGDFGDLSRGDLSRGDLSRGDLSRGDLSLGDLSLGDLGDACCLRGSGECERDLDGRSRGDFDGLFSRKRRRRLPRLERRHPLRQAGTDFKHGLEALHTRQMGPGQSGKNDDGHGVQGADEGTDFEQQINLCDRDQGKRQKEFHVLCHVQELHLKTHHIQCKDLNHRIEIFY